MTCSSKNCGNCVCSSGYITNTREVDYDLACLPLYKEFLQECKDLKECQDSGNVLDFAQTLLNLVEIHTKVTEMGDEVGTMGKFLVFDKMFSDIETFMIELYKKLPHCGLV